MSCANYVGNGVICKQPREFLLRHLASRTLVITLAEQPMHPDFTSRDERSKPERMGLWLWMVDSMHERIDLDQLDGLEIMGTLMEQTQFSSFTSSLHYAGLCYDLTSFFDWKLEEKQGEEEWQDGDANHGVFWRRRRMMMMMMIMIMIMVMMIIMMLMMMLMMMMMMMSDGWWWWW